MYVCVHMELLYYKCTVEMWTSVPCRCQHTIGQEPCSPTLSPASHDGRIGCGWAVLASNASLIRTKSSELTTPYSMLVCIVKQCINLLNFHTRVRLPIMFCIHPYYNTVLVAKTSGVIVPTSISNGPINNKRRATIGKDELCNIFGKKRRLFKWLEWQELETLFYPMYKCIILQTCI